MNGHRWKGNQRALREFELVPLGIRSTSLSVLSWIRDIFSTWAGLALEGRPASWALGLPPTSSSTRAIFPQGASSLPLANLGS